MKFIAQIDVMPLPNLLDPQGKAVKNTLSNLKFTSVNNVRIGKHIVIEIEAPEKEDAKQIAEKICQKVLANPVMETYNIIIQSTENI